GSSPRHGACCRGAASRPGHGVAPHVVSNISDRFPPPNGVMPRLRAVAPAICPLSLDAGLLTERRESLWHFGCNGTCVVCHVGHYLNRLTCELPTLIFRN